MIFDLVCLDTERWSVDDGHGSCPDCHALIAEGSIPDHVRWHETLVCQLLAVCANQDQLSELNLELGSEQPGDCVRIAHELQVTAVRSDDR